MDQMQINEQHRRSLGGLGHDLMLLPDFLEQRFGFAHDVLLRPDRRAAASHADRAFRQ
jgi:hypothetical protein